MLLAGPLACLLALAWAAKQEGGQRGVGYDATSIPSIQQYGGGRGRGGTAHLCFQQRMALDLVR